MKIKELVTTLLPKPRLPQKRYMIAGVFIIYGALKLYTAITPDTSDDTWPEKFKETVYAVLNLGD